MKLVKIEHKEVAKLFDWLELEFIVEDGSLKEIILAEGKTRIHIKPGDYGNSLRLSREEEEGLEDRWVVDFKNVTAMFEEEHEAQAFADKNDIPRDAITEKRVKVA